MLGGTRQHEKQSMKYTILADNRHQNGQPLKVDVGSITEAIEGAANAMAGSDFIHVQVQGEGSKIQAATILAIWQALHAPRT